MSTVKETLEKQLQLLSELSANSSSDDLEKLTHSMLEISSILLRVEEQTRWRASGRASLDQAWEQITGEN